MIPLPPNGVFEEEGRQYPRACPVVAHEHVGQAVEAVAKPGHIEVEVEQVAVQPSRLRPVRVAVDGVVALHRGLFRRGHGAVEEAFLHVRGHAGGCHDESLRFVQPLGNGRGIELPVHESALRRHFFLLVQLVVHREEARQVVHALRLRHLDEHFRVGDGGRSLSLHLGVQGVEPVLHLTYVHHERRPGVASGLQEGAVVVGPQPVLQLSLDGEFPEDGVAGQAGVRPFAVGHVQGV